MDEIVKLQNIFYTNPGLSIKQYQNLMGYSGSLRRMLIGYMDQVQGRGRNYYLK